MAENAAPEVQEPPPRHKRSLLKLLLLALNVVLFLAGVGSLAWTKFGPKPVASAVAQGQDQHEDQKGTAAHEPAAKGHEAPPRRQLRPKPPAAMVAALAQNLRVARAAAVPLHSCLSRLSLST